MPISFDQAEKEYYEPPDDIVGECEICGGIDVLTECHGKICCQDCAKEYHENLTDVDDEIEEYDEDE